LKGSTSIYLDAEKKVDIKVDRASDAGESRGKSVILKLGKAITREELNIPLGRKKRQ